MAARPRRPKPPQAAAPTAARGARWSSALLIVAVALAVYAGSLRNGFVWDDPIIISRQLVVFRSVGDVLVPPRDIPQFSPDYYRPLTIGSYLLDRAVGGGAPLPFHLSVAVAHALTAALVWALALQLLAAGAPRRAIGVGALVAGLLFAVHPIHTESVAWAAGRSDVLATAGVLAALVAHGRWPWSWRGSLSSGVAAAVALGAKEAGIALYPLLVLRDLLIEPARRHLGEWLRAYAGVAGAGLGYLALRHAALGELVGTAAQAAPVTRSATEVLSALGAYVGALLWPWPLNAYIDHIPSGLVPLLLALAFAAALGVAAWRWWRDDRLPLFALGWIALTLVPSLAILWKIPDAPLAERYLYLPSVGFCLLCGDLAARAWSAARQSSARAALAAALGAVVLLAGVATMLRNPVWHDDIALWTDTESKSQVSGMAARNLATAYQQSGRTADARATFARALTRRNDARGLQTIYNNLGTIAMMEGDFAAAQRAYEQALAPMPNAPDTLFNLGLAVLQSGGATPEAARRALPYYERARVMNPHDADIETALGQAYLLTDQRERAVEHLRQALQLNPSPHTRQGAQQLLQQAGADAPAS
jgi:tetratricopeptide (TPR) repeat protein